MNGKVSKQDRDLLRHKWYVCKRGGYLARNVRSDSPGRRQRQVFMHRIVMERMIGREPVWPQEHVDHINHDPSDNRRSNLRLTDSRGNQLNRSGLQSNNKTGIDGLCLTKVTRKQRTYTYWLCQVTVEGVRHKKQFRLQEKEDAIEWIRERRP